MSNNFGAEVDFLTLSFQSRDYDRFYSSGQLVDYIVSVLAQCGVYFFLGNRSVGRLVQYKY